MLARRLTTMLPTMTLAEAIETTRIHSVAGLTGDRTALVTTRPERCSLCSSISMRTGNDSYG
jgi:magnesium chelatase family protein